VPVHSRSPVRDRILPSESHGADDDCANAASSAMLSIEPSSSNSRRRSSMASLSSISPSGSDLVTSSPTRILVGRFQKAHIPYSYASFSGTTPEPSAALLSTATVYPSEKGTNEAVPRHRLQSRSSSDKNKAEMTISLVGDSSAPDEWGGPAPSSPSSQSAMNFGDPPPAKSP